MNKLKIRVLVSFASIVISACGSEPTANKMADSAEMPKTPRPAATIDEFASGKKVFELNCMVCHKSDGTGGKVTVEGKSLNVDNLTSAKIKAFTDEKIIGYILKGIPSEGMPSFKDKLSEGEMRDVVLYIRKEFHGR